MDKNIQMLLKTIPSEKRSFPGGKKSITVGGGMNVHLMGTANRRA